MGKPIEEIHAKFQERVRLQNPQTLQAIKIRDLVNGDVVVPVLDKSVQPAIINFASQGIDSYALRMASTQPEIEFTPLKRGQDKWEKQAALQRQAGYGYWYKNRMKIKDYRRYRYFVAYGSAPVILRPDIANKCPYWEIRDPLTTYPAPSHDPDELTPQDCIFTYRRPFAWIKRYYPHIINNKFFDQYKNKASTSAVDEQYFTILEYNDSIETVLGVTGSPTQTNLENYYSTADMQRGPQIVELDRIPNRVGKCLVVNPGRISLDRRQGQFDYIGGLYSKMGQLMEYSFEAAKRGVFPEQWVVARPGEAPEIIDADPERGVVGVVQGGDLREVQINPSYMSTPMLDRLERYIRSEGGMPTEFGGESGARIRTGAQGQSVLQAAISFDIQEAQEVMAMAKEEELKLAIEIEKNYWGKESKSIYVAWPGARGRAEYTPNELFTNAEVHCFYSQAGVDVNGQAILVGQLNGMGIMSRKSAAQMIPVIEDVEGELDKVTSERLEDALLSSIQTQAAQGAIPPADLASIMSYVEQDKYSLADAITKVQEEAQKRQSTTEEPVLPGSPEAQPGLAQPGMGAEAGIAGPSQDTQDLNSLLMALRGPQMATAAEQPIEAAV